MRFGLDPERSTLTIHATSSIHPIETATTVTGWIELDVSADGTPAADQAPAAEIELALGEMRSGNPLVDREAERRLDVRRHPTVHGVLTQLGAPDADGRRMGAGDLTFHGVTRRITGELSITTVDGGLHLTGHTELDVTDFGVQPPSLLVVKVHREVRVELDAFASSGD